MFKKNQNKKIILLTLMLFSQTIYVVINRTVTTIPVGYAPVNMAITPDGRFGYVANDNNDSVPGQDTVSVIDLKTNKVVQTISDSSFNQPYTVTMNAEGSKVYITNTNGSTVTIIDVATNTVIGVITGFDGPSGMAIMPNGRTAYVNNYGSPAGLGSGNANTIRVVDLETNTIIGAAIVVDLAPAALAITPDGAFVYVVNYVDGNPNTGTISVIDTRTNKVVQTIPGLSGPYDIIIDDCGHYAYISNFGSNNFAPVGKTVSVLDLKINTIISNIELGTQPSGLALSPNNALLYVTIYNTLYLGANYTDLTSLTGTVSIVNTANNKVVCQDILAGDSPASITVSHDGKRAYVTNYRSRSVTVLNIDDRMWLN